MNVSRVILLFIPILVFSQNKQETNAIDVNFFQGNVLLHSQDLGHLLGHPEGFMINFSRQTHGNKEWHKAYNYPDYGGYFLYQDFNNAFLGKMYSAGLNYNFYFFNRTLQFKVAEGIAYATNPYNKETNSKNKSFGTNVTANTNISLLYKKDYLLAKFGVQAGILFTHYSNGRIKSPNSGVNSYNLSFGVNYNFNDKVKTVTDTVKFDMKFTEPLKYNFVLRSGVNESALIRSGQFAFYHLGTYIDKRINRKSALQFGADLFITPSLKELIKFQSVAYPEKNIDASTDFKRVGLFVGHELFINKLSFETQVGLYVYKPFKNDTAMYNRVGAKYYITKNIFSSFHIKTHLFLAEALEFGVGYRL